MFKRPDNFIFVIFYFIYLFEWVDIQIYPKPEHVEANNNNNNKKVTFFLSLTFYFTKKLILLRELTSSENNKDGNTLDLNQCFRKIRDAVLEVIAKIGT